VLICAIHALKINCVQKYINEDVGIGNPMSGLATVEPYVISLYKGGYSTVEIGRMFGRSGEAVRKFLKRRNVRMRTQAETSRKHIINHHYFRKISTKNKAFWLGYVFVNGIITRKGDQSWIVTIYSSQKHLQRLTALRHATGCSKPPYHQKDRDRWVLSINSTSWATSLKRMGWSEFRDGDHGPLLDKLDPELHEAFYSGFNATSE
jgi:hypothetical protein